MKLAPLALFSLSLLLSSVLMAQDEPERGASFFDAMLEQTGLHYDGQILPNTPHPFEDLVLKLNQHSTFFASLIPFGRSLQKMAAYPDVLKHPRLVLATSEQSKKLNTHFRGRLFIAYVEAAKKLEVISFNPLMSRYEFQIVDQFYPGGKAQLRYVPRALCLRCHQGGTPIFAGGEWLETTAFNPALQKLTEKALGSKEYFGIPITRDDVAKKFEAVPRPEHFEDMVRFGALLVGYQKAWQDLCALSQQPLVCKKQLIKWMLVSNLSEKLSLEPDLELLSHFLKVLGKGKVAIPTEKLIDHDPVVNGQLSLHMPPDIDPSLPREEMQLMMPSEKDPLGLQFFKFHIFVKTFGESYFTEQDFRLMVNFLGDKPKPLMLQHVLKRGRFKLRQAEAKQYCLPDPGDFLMGLNQKVGTSLSLQVQCFNRNNWRRFVDAIDQLPLTAKDPLSREWVLLALDKALGTKLSQSMCCQTQAKHQAKNPVESKSILAPDAIRRPNLQSFVKYCSECHLYQDLPPPFLAGASEGEISENIRKRSDLIRFRLENKQMPPHFARLTLSEDERKSLLRDLSSISQP